MPWRSPSAPALTPPLAPQVKRVFCESSGALVPKDKAVKRFIVRNIVESAAIRDLQESCVFDCACPAGRPRAGAAARPRARLRRRPVARVVFAGSASRERVWPSPRAAEP
jgi:hypothetical protein